MTIHVKDIAQVCDVSIQSVYLWVKSGFMPKPINRPGKPMEWDHRTIAQWISNKGFTLQPSGIAALHNVEKLRDGLR